jgi:hypothetical protein
MKVGPLEVRPYGPCAATCPRQSRTGCCVVTTTKLAISCVLIFIYSRQQIFQKRRNCGTALVFTQITEWFVQMQTMTPNVIAYQPDENFFPSGNVHRDYELRYLVGKVWRNTRCRRSRCEKSGHPGRGRRSRTQMARAILTARAAPHPHVRRSRALLFVVILRKALTARTCEQVRGMTAPW